VVFRAVGLVVFRAVGLVVFRVVGFVVFRVVDFARAVTVLDEVDLELFAFAEAPVLLLAVVRFFAAELRLLELFFAAVPLPVLFRADELDLLLDELFLAAVDLARDGLFFFALEDRELDELFFFAPVLLERVREPVDFLVVGITSYPPNFSNFLQQVHFANIVPIILYGVETVGALSSLSLSKIMVGRLPLFVGAKICDLLIDAPFVSERIEEFSITRSPEHILDRH